MMRLLRNALAVAGLLVLVIIGTPLVPWAVARCAAPWGNDEGPVLVVLGGDMLVPGTGPDATLGTDTYLRCVMAALLARRNPYRYIVVTGAWGVSAGMERFLVCHGVDRDRILQENAARSTYENAQFTKRILQSIYGNSLPRIVLLTSDFHSRRAWRTFEHAGFDVSAVPAPDLIKRCSTRSFRLEAFQTLAVELAALAFYELKGYA